MRCQGEVEKGSGRYAVRNRQYAVCKCIFILSHQFTPKERQTNLNEYTRRTTEIEKSEPRRNICDNLWLKTFR